MKKIFFLITVLFSIFSLNSTASNLLSNPGFEEKPYLKGWNKGIYGDKKGKIGLVDIARSGDYGVGIYSSYEESWTFLRQIFNDIPKGKELTLIAWVFSSSRKAKIVITSGFVWGGSGAGHKSKSASHSGSSHWKRLKVNIEVEELPVSVAVGFDYQSPDSQMVVDNLYLGIGSPSSVLKEYKVRKAKPKREGLAMDKVVIPQAIEGKKDVLISQIETFLDGYKSFRYASGSRQALKKRKAVSPNFLKVIDEKESFFKKEIKKFKAKVFEYVSSQKAISTDLWNKLKEPLQKQTNRIAPPVVYRKNPLSNVTPDDLPENVSSLKTLEIYGAVNENISATLCFFNPSSYSLRILIRISDLQGPAKIRAKEFEVREALYIGKKDKVYADALSSLGEADSILVPERMLKLTTVR